MKMKRIISLLLALLMLFAMMSVGQAADEKLRLNDRGTAVKELQQMLSQLGYTVTVDGVFGSGTEKAVKQFQSDRGLKVDGIAGSATLSLLRSLTNSSSSSGSQGIFGGNYSVLRPKDSGSRVRLLQKALYDLGYDISKVDGVYGSGTEAAVRLFQQLQGLKVDGKAGEDTLRCIEGFFNADGTVRSDYTPPAAQTTPTKAPSTSGTMPNRTLRPGDSGDDVRSVQTRLKELGYYTGTIDGKYGTGTTEAVYQFQKRNGLKADGKAGTDTNKVLFSANAIAAGETKTNAPATATPAPQGGMPTRILRPGDSGEDVRSVQSRLKELGYYTGALDGKYGALTTSAVTAFQKRNGLKADGKAGTDTNKVLFSANALAAAATATPGTSATAAPSTGSTMFGGNYAKLSKGSTGTRVRTLQTALNKLGYSVGSVDGVYGTATDAAVRLFQKKYGLKVDGIAGEKTLRAIENCFNPDGSVRSDYTPPATVPPSTGTAVPNRVLRPGDTGDDVRAVQTRLKELGYYTGSIDGKYGTGTTTAVSDFQRKNGLKVDGKAGSDTYAKLFSDSAIPANGTSGGSNATATPAPAPTPTPTPQYNVPSRTLRSGDSGTDVITVQTRLKELGYYTGKLDGIYGTSTVAAVKEFQKANGLNADGKAGPLTYAVLFSSKAVGKGGSGTTTSPSIYATLKKGSTGEAVTQLQKALLNLGYTVNTNGTYTNETVAAVKQFQSANGLAVDGIAGPLTLAKLYSGTAAGPSNSTSGPGTTTAGVMANPPSNSQIKLLHWYNDIKPNLPSQPTVQIYDPASGLTWNIKIFSKGQHADGEPPTRQDTQIMYKAFGNQFTWNEKPVFVKLPSGVWCIASMHDRPHEADMIPPSINGFEGTFKGVYEKGHLCIHFPRDMAETKKNAPVNGVRHQNDIRKKWKEMTGQDIPW